jgi:hypothetical protein
MMTKPISVLYKYKGRGSRRDEQMPYTPPRETLAVAASRPNSEALATRVVQAHPRATFHPRMCGLLGGAVVLFDCDNVEVAAGTTTRRRRS